MIGASSIRVLHLFEPFGALRWRSAGNLLPPCNQHRSSESVLLVSLSLLIPRSFGRSFRATTTCDRISRVADRIANSARDTSRSRWMNRFKRGDQTMRACSIFTASTGRDHHPAIGELIFADLAIKRHVA
jgi:hypothetical protein